MNPPIAMQVASLHIYPIKSCAGMDVSEITFAPEGQIVLDREWAVANAAKGEVTWQGAYPRLALVKPQYDGTTLTLTTAAGASCRILPFAESGTCAFIIWNDRDKRNEVHHGTDAGEDAAEFLREVTGAHLRLVRLSREAIQRAAAHPIHLISQQSIEELNRSRQARGQAPTSVMRFRPNMVLRDGENLGPFPEEHIAQLSGASCQLEIYQRCIRCVVPDVDPALGTIKTGILKSVAQLTADRFPKEPPSLGVYGRATQRGTLRMGDIVVSELL